MKPTLFCSQAEDLVKQKFEFPLAEVEDQDDSLMKGEFMVMLELMQELPGAKEGKEKVNNEHLWTRPGHGNLHEFKRPTTRSTGLSTCVGPVLEERVCKT